MWKNTIIICSLLFFTGCSVLFPKFHELLQQVETGEILYNIKVNISSDALPLGAEYQIKPESISSFFSLLPAFSINTNKPFKTGGQILFEFPIPKQFSNIYSGDITQVSLCYYNFKHGLWEKIDTKFDPSQNLLQAIIPSLKNDNLDETMSKLLVSVSLPSKEGLISNLYQQNKFVETSQGNLKNFLTENDSGKNCIIIHGVSSNPENMQNLFNTILNLHHYKNIIFYQYASGDYIKNNAEWLAKNITTNPDVKFDIIAHSMGGLVARCAIEEFGLDKNADKLIMLGTPNNGGNLTEFAPVLFPKTAKTLVETFPGVQDLITGSKFFSINKDYDRTKIKTKYYVLAGDIGGDNLVKSDIWVSVVSATFLHIEPGPILKKDFTRGHEIVTLSGWKYYKKLSDSSTLNMFYEHSNLHLLSSNNGVAEQLDEWIKE